MFVQNNFPEDYQIRRSNVHTLVSLLEQIKVFPDSIHISDNKPLLKKKIENININDIRYFFKTDPTNHKQMNRKRY